MNRTNIVFLGRIYFINPKYLDMILEANDVNPDKTAVDVAIYLVYTICHSII